MCWNAKYNFVWFFNCTVCLRCLLEIWFPFSEVWVCVRVCASVVFFRCSLLFLVFWVYCYSSVNILDISEQILSSRGFVFCIQLFNDAIISLLLSHFTPPFVGFVRIRPIANRWSKEKKNCVSEITVESGFSLVILNAIQDLQGCSCNKVAVRCSFLLSVLLAPSWGWYLKVCEL